MWWFMKCEFGVPSNVTKYVPSFIKIRPQFFELSRADGHNESYRRLFRTTLQKKA
jgi:hypothetical protein